MAQRAASQRGEPDTIAAIASPPGAGAVAIVRLSGPLARDIASKVFTSRRALRDRAVVFGSVIDAGGIEIDRGLALYFAAPHSYTGDDVVELQVHGSPIVARETLGAVLAAGARMAHPGEFTRRAFEAGKMDLSSAEAVGALIGAEHRSEARAAAAGLAGGVAREVQRLRRELATVVEELSAALDFPDEVDLPDGGVVHDRVAAVRDAAAALALNYERGLSVRFGTSVAIVGPPNAGKSSLLNALLETERALVSPVPGTTRDTIEESVAVDGVRLRIVDTAGLRETGDPLERAGIQRTQLALAHSRIALVVVDGSAPLNAAAAEILRTTRDRERVVLFNKRDAGVAGFEQREDPERDALSGSAYEKQTVAAVRNALAALVRQGEMPDAAHAHLTSARQAGAALEAQRLLDAVCRTIERGEPLDLCASDLIAAIGALDAISGRDASEAVLDGIFSRFCIGK